MHRLQHVDGYEGEPAMRLNCSQKGEGRRERGREEYGVARHEKKTTVTTTNTSLTSVRPTTNVPSSLMTEQPLSQPALSSRTSRWSRRVKQMDVILLSEATKRNISRPSGLKPSPVTLAWALSSTSVFGEPFPRVKSPW